MTGFINFNPSIPQPTDIPSVSQGQLLTNFTSDKSIWNVDHISFQANYGGTHVQNTFVGFSTPSFPAGTGSNASIAYPAAGIDKNTTAQYYFTQNNGSSTIFPLSAIKAFGVFVPINLSTPQTITPLNGFNITGTIAQTTSGTDTTWVITLNPLAVTSNNAAVFVLQSTSSLANSPSFLNWALTGAGPSNVLTIKQRNNANIPTQPISFAILQI